MPGFGDNLTDAQTATLTNYVRNQYGNGGDNVDAAAVKTLRDNNVTVIPGYLLIAGGGVGALIVIGPFFFRELFQVMLPHCVTWVFSAHH